MSIDRLFECMHDACEFPVGHPDVRYVEVDFNIRALITRASLLDLLDGMFNVNIGEQISDSSQWGVWRKLTVSGIELRLCFHMKSFGCYFADRLCVTFYGIKAINYCGSIDISCVKSLDGFLYFLEQIRSFKPAVPLRQDRLLAIAMGQHARLGEQSVLLALPVCLFECMVQFHDTTTLEAWDIEKEKMMLQVIHPCEYERNQELIGALVGQGPCPRNPGSICFQGGFTMDEMRALCAGLDERSTTTGVLPGSDDVRCADLIFHDVFIARRELRIGHFQLSFEFYWYEDTAFINVDGIGFLDHVPLSCKYLDGPMFNRFLDGVFRLVPRFYEKYVPPYWVYARMLAVDGYDIPP